jgi:hypothetical protein
MAAPIPAFAQDDPLTVQARARFKEGVDYYDKGNYEAARASFLQAYALKSHPAVLLNLAQSCLKANHPIEAIKYFKKYLAEVQNPTPQQRHDAEAGLEEARNKVGHIDIVAPAGTEVSVIGGERLGNAPFPDGFDLEPGSFSLKSRATDGSSETIKVNLQAGQRQQVKFGGGATAQNTVTPVPTPPPPAGNTPATPPDTGAGTPPTPPDNGQNPPPDTGVTTKKTNILSPPANLVPVFIGGGVGVVGIGVAIALFISKNNAQSSADQLDNTIRTTATGAGLQPKGICSAPPTKPKDFTGACTTYKSDLDQVNADATGANIAGAIGAVGIVFAAGWYLLTPKKDAAQEAPPGSAPAPQPSAGAFNVAPTPIIGPGIGGMSFTGTF